ARKTGRARADGRAPQPRPPRRRDRLGRRTADRRRGDPPGNPLPAASDPRPLLTRPLLSRHSRLDSFGWQGRTAVPAPTSRVYRGQSDGHRTGEGRAGRRGEGRGGDYRWRESPGDQGAWGG